MHDRFLETLEVVVGLLGAVVLMAVVGSLVSRIKPPVDANPATATAVSVCAALAENAGVRIVAAPEPDAETLGLISFGQRLDVINTLTTRHGLWFEVRYADQTGWMLGTDVSPIYDCSVAFATLTPAPTP